MNISAILLAAGSAVRFGRNKLCHPYKDDMPMVVMAYNNLRTSFDDVVVVVNDNDGAIQRLLSTHEIKFVTFENASTGMGASLAFGIKQRPDADAWVIALGDMPSSKPETMIKVTQEIQQGKPLVVPRYHGQQGHPVAFARDFYALFAALDGDRGGKGILESNQSLLTSVDVNDPGCVFDIDTQDDLFTD